MRSKITQLLSCVWFAYLLAGCASIAKIENTSLSEASGDDAYSIDYQLGIREESDLFVILTFSGGGTRAAATAYGVMQELRDTAINQNGEKKRLLDEVTSISSVSGGSFTAAYYGLNGEDLFENFESEFLRFNIEKKLISMLFNPLGWFTHTGRTEKAIEYYQELLFKNATFADLSRPDRPFIMINASDLTHGVRFSFIQEYFNLLCSDLATFPVARAVTASSAVPVVFNPVVVKNHADCPYEDVAWLRERQQQFADDEDLVMVTYGLQTYADKENRKFIHLVDGGITDNTGLRAIYDIVEVAGGATEYFRKFQRKIPSQIVVISVNASTDPVTGIDLTNKRPSMADTMNAMSGVQLHRYNSATETLVKKSLIQWAQELSTAEKQVTPYFVEVSFEDVKDPELNRFINGIPTSFSLTDDQVDTLIKTSRELLRDNRVFQQLVSDLNQ